MRLFELTQRIRQTLENEFDDTYWVTAEVSDIGTSGGHCYLEFVEKSPFSDDTIAKARGNIWASQWNKLRPKFERSTGQPLSRGMQVLVNVRITFSEKYGFSLNVVDIDPTYTMGDIARRRKAIIDQLKADGIFDCNKELELPTITNRIAVISSATAAGYQDFCHQLENNSYKLKFSTKLFPAVMQGQSVESSVIEALDAINAELDKWDVVVIIRGGGATSDLSGFDSYLLGANVAQFPLPIITGIGHERDNTVIDEVSNTRVKTPTAAAEFLISHQYDTLSSLLDMEDFILDYCRQSVVNEQHRIRTITDKFPTLFRMRKERELHYLNTLTMRSTDGVKYVKEQKHSQLEMVDTRLKYGTNKLLVSNKHLLEIASSKISSASPERLLKLGFSITRADGKAVCDIYALKAGTEIMTTVANGTFSSTVNPAKPKEPKPPTHLTPPGYDVHLA